jgi:cytochrome c oxidase subunit 4
MALTALTVYVAFQHLGWLNFPVAITIAFLKASLVVLFFMHVKYSSKLTKLLVASTFFFLASLFGLTMTDYMSRGWLTSPAAPPRPGCCPSSRRRNCPPRARRRSPTRSALRGHLRQLPQLHHKTAPTLDEIHNLYSNDASERWSPGPRRRSAKRMRFEPMPSFAHLGDARLHALANYMLQQAAQTRRQ